MIAALVIDGLLFAAIIGMTWFGAVTLPPGTRIPYHARFSRETRYQSKKSFLVSSVAYGAVFFAGFALFGGRSWTRFVGAAIFLVIIAAATWNSIWKARKNPAQDPAQ